jgi:hypothetical protein
MKAVSRSSSERLVLQETRTHRPSNHTERPTTLHIRLLFAISLPSRDKAANIRSARAIHDFPLPKTFVVMAEILMGSAFF